MTEGQQEGTIRLILEPKASPSIEFRGSGLSFSGGGLPPPRVQERPVWHILARYSPTPPGPVRITLLSMQPKPEEFDISRGEQTGSRAQVGVDLYFDAYRRGALSIGQLARLLDATFFATLAELKRRGIMPLLGPTSVGELEEDVQAAKRFARTSDR